MSQASALLWSIAIEAAVAAVFVRAMRWGRPERAAIAAAVATIATHWLAWDAMLRLADPTDYLLALVAIEAVVATIEAVGYRLIAVGTFFRALVVSLCANAASAGVGVVLDALDML